MASRIEAILIWGIISLPLVALGFFAVLLSVGLNSTSISGINPIIGFPLAIFVAMQIIGQISCSQLNKEEE